MKASVQGKRRSGLQRSLAVYGHVPGLAFWRAIELEMWDEILPSATAAMDGVVLDLACGAGIFTSQLELDFKPVGLDLEYDLVRRAGSSGAYRAVVNANGCEIPCRDASFDFVFSNSSLEHVRGVARLLEEACRVMKPGGELVFIVPTDRFEQVLLRPRMLGALGLAGLANRARSATIRDTDTFNLLSAQQWRDLVDRAGLDVAEIRPFMPRSSIWLWEVLNYGYTKSVLGIRFADIVRRFGRVHAGVMARLLAGAVHRGMGASDAVQILVRARRPLSTSSPG